MTGARVNKSQYCNRSDEHYKLGCVHALVVLFTRNRVDMLCVESFDIQ
jgi:hypothetical protein